MHDVRQPLVHRVAEGLADGGVARAGLEGGPGRDVAAGGVDVADGGDVADVPATARLLAHDDALAQRRAGEPDRVAGQARPHTASGHGFLRHSPCRPGTEKQLRSASLVIAESPPAWGDHNNARCPRQLLNNTDIDETGDNVRIRSMNNFHEHDIDNTPDKVYDADAETDHDNDNECEWQ